MTFPCVHIMEHARCYCCFSWSIAEARNKSSRKKSTAYEMKRKSGKSLEKQVLLLSLQKAPFRSFALNASKMIKNKKPRSERQNHEVSSGVWLSSSNDQQADDIECLNVTEAAIEGEPSGPRRLSICVPFSKVLTPSPIAQDSDCITGLSIALANFPAISYSCTCNFF